MVRHEVIGDQTVESLPVLLRRTDNVDFDTEWRRKEEQGSLTKRGEAAVVAGSDYGTATGRGLGEVQRGGGGGPFVIRPSPRGEDICANTNAP
jgi:hypothetical protein